MRHSVNAGQRRPSSAVRYRLSSLFIVTAVCAILLVLYGYFGNAIILFLLLTGAACLAVLWMIDASRVTRDMLMRVRRPRSSLEEPKKHFDDDGDLDRRRAVEQSRELEELANARYNAATGPEEDVLRSKAIRLQAEIDFIRHMNSKKHSKRH